MLKSLLAALALSSVAAFSAFAKDPVKIGVITTLSGPGGYLGQDIKDGFKLVVDSGGGSLGGIPVELVVQDDGLNPGHARQIADRLLSDDHIKLFTGIVFSNVAQSAVPEILDAGAFYVSANAGPSNFAGKDCHPNYFVASWQNDSLHESAGQLATNLGYKKAFVLAPNYQAGKDAISGFKRFFKGEIAGEAYTRLDQTDFAPEMAEIRAANPDVVFQFHPGGLGISFLRQYEQAGLMKSIPMVVAAPSMDEVILKTVGDAALGLNVTSHWNADFDNPASKAFVEAFKKAYSRQPTYYASQGYDAALLVASALKATNGDLSNPDAFRAALRKGDFASVRGAFRFGSNQHPIQDWYALKVVKGDDGKLMLKTQGKILSDHGDAYASQCKM